MVESASRASWSQFSSSGGAASIPSSPYGEHLVVVPPTEESWSWSPMVMGDLNLGERPDIRASKES